MKKNVFTTKKIVGKLYHFALLLIVTLAISCSKSSTRTPVPVPVPTPTVIPPIDTIATTAKQIIVNMGAGFDLGNTFDKSTIGYTPNLDNIKSIINLYCNAGMIHVRIPITWLEGFPINLADSNGNVNLTHPTLLLIKSVVDYTL